MQIPQTQYDVLRALADEDAALLVPQLAGTLGRDQAQITAACVALEQAGHLRVTEREYEELTLGKDALPYVDTPLPERLIVAVLAQHGGSIRITDIPQHCGLDAGQVGQSLRWLSQRGWASKQGENLVLANPAPPAEQTPDEHLIQALADGKPARRADLERGGVPVEPALAFLAKRKGFLTIKPRTDRSVELTDAGRALLASGVTGRRSVTQLTPELLGEGGWREVDLQPYDVALAAKKLYPGKDHAFQRTLDRVRRVFLEMGFTEVVSPWVESSFWDFDALFQPQDHPARDMQDTFYVARPNRCRLPDDALVERIRGTHETGGDTGSTGWRYQWSRDLAHKPVLRTHTTAATIRALAAHAQRQRSVRASESRNVEREESSASPAPSPLPASPPSRGHREHASVPGKYFVIGPVFRRETVDYKHLPVFHQVDGIIVDRHASLSTLLGTLSAFYGKMGFPRIRFRPSFFPYTEPSAEVFLWLEHRKEWVEMGGSGIFRPEVTQPLGIHDRVLAWGLGLERLAMMIHGLKAIGDLYFATMPWLRETPVCRA